MKKSKIVCIGAGSFSFGLSSLVTLLQSDRLRGSEIVLVDRNQEALDLISELAIWLNEAWGCESTFFPYTSPTSAGRRGFCNLGNRSAPTGKIMADGL